MHPEHGTRNHEHTCEPSAQSSEREASETCECISDKKRWLSGPHNCTPLMSFFLLYMHRLKIIPGTWYTRYINDTTSGHNIVAVWASVQIYTSIYYQKKAREKSLYHHVCDELYRALEKHKNDQNKQEDNLDFVSLSMGGRSSPCDCSSWRPFKETISSKTVFWLWIRISLRDKKKAVTKIEHVLVANVRASSITLALFSSEKVSRKKVLRTKVSPTRYLAH